MNVIFLLLQVDGTTTGGGVGPIVSRTYKRKFTVLPISSRHFVLHLYDLLH